MKDRIVKSVFWIVWSRGAVQVLSFLSTLVVARLLSPADYGLMALAGMWTFVISLVAELGLGAAVVQFRDVEECEVNTCFWLTMSMAGTGYLALYAAAPALAAWFVNPMLSDVLRVAGLSLPLIAVRIIPDSLLRRRLQLDKVSKAEIASAAVTIPVVLGMAWYGAGVWALVAGAVVMPLVQSVVSFWFVRWWPGLRIGSRRLNELLRYSLATLGSRLGWAAYQQLDMFLVGKLSGEVVLGFYSMAKLLANLPSERISVAVLQLASPVLAGLQADRTAMRTSFLRGLRLVASLTVPLCLGMGLVADDLVYVALGDKWIPVVPLLQVLCLAGLIRSLDVLLPPVLFARYRATFMVWWTGGVLLTMTFVFWAGAAWMGALGVALGWLVVYPFITAWMAREGLRELEMGWKTLWDQLRPVAGAALVMAGCVLVVHWGMPDSDFVHRFMRLAVASGLGALVYGLGMLWWARPLVREMAEVTGWILRWSRRASSDVQGLAPDPPRITEVNESVRSVN